MLLEVRFSQTLLSLSINACPATLNHHKSLFKVCSIRDRNLDSTSHQGLRRAFHRMVQLERTRIWSACSVMMEDKDLDLPSFPHRIGPAALRTQTVSPLTFAHLAAA